MQNKWHDLLAFTRLLAARFGEDRCPQVAASLTFTTLLSLVPLVTIALTIFSAFPVFEEFSIQIKIFLLMNLVPDMAGKIITDYMVQFTNSAMQLTAIGIVFLGVTAMMLLQTIEQTFNIIWRVKHSRSIIKRFVAYWAVITLAPLLLGGSIALTSWFAGMSAGYVEYVPFLGKSVLKLLPVLLTWIAFTLIFRLVPNRYVPLSHALAGALLAAILFALMNWFFAFYVSRVPTYHLVYGAFASLPIFLMWIYFSWLSILTGALITASFSYWHTSPAGQRSAAMKMLDVLNILQALVRAQRLGERSSLPELSRSLKLSYDRIEAVISTLADAGLVEQTRQGGWVLLRAAQQIKTAEILRLFVLNGDDLRAVQQRGDAVVGWLAHCADRMVGDEDMTLDALFPGENR
jgi:membrane protein